MRDRFGYTPLHYAAEYDREDRVRCLISMKVDKNARAKDGTTPLHCAVAAKSHYGVEVLLDNKVDVNAERTDGITALHLACIFPKQEILTLLLDNNVDIYRPDCEGRTALMFLCNADNETDEVLSMLALLLAHRPTHVDRLLEQTDRHGRTALHYACAKGNTTIVMDLVKIGANVRTVDNYGKNGLHLAVQSNEGIKMLNTLTLKSKTIVTTRDKKGFLPVHYAAMKRNPQVIVELLKLGKTKSNFLPQSGMPYQLTPLHLSARYGHADNVMAIIKFYTDPPKEDSVDDCTRNFEALKITDGATNSQNTSFEQESRRLYDPFTAEDNLRRIPLHYAMAYGFYPDMTMLLPKEKCSTLLGWKDTDGVTPLMMAAANGNDKCVEYALSLLEDNPKARLVKQAVDDQKRSAAMFSVTAKGEAYKRLVTADIVSRKDRQLRGFIHRAAFAKKNGLLANIITWAPTEINSEDAKKVTALHIACSSGNVKGAELLLEAGADLKKMDANKLTASDWAAAAGQSAVLSLLLTKYKDRVLLSEFAIAKACEHGSLKCVQLLVGHFPEMAQCLAEHKPPLHLSAELGYEGLCRCLIQNGALMDARDCEGYTPLMLAARCPKSEDCVALLTEQAECPLVAQGPDGNSALHLACLHNNLNSAIHIYNALVLRKELPLVLAQKNNKDESLLHLSVKMTSQTMLTEFLKHMKSSSIADRDNRGRQPLYSMIEQPEVIENMRLLMMKLIKLEREDANNSTANISTFTGRNRSQLQDDGPFHFSVDESY